MSIVFGKYISHWINKTPRRLLFALSYYDFAANIIGKNKKVLDIGCNEGLGTYLLSRKCGFAKGIDFDKEAILSAKKNFDFCNLEFEEENIFENKDENKWDAIVNFDVIEHILPTNADAFFKKIQIGLKENGFAIIGTPSLISQQFASEVTKKGHINVYTHKRLEKEMRKHFKYVFLFAAHDEIVHTGFLPMANYYIFIGCKKL